MALETIIDVAEIDDLGFRVVAEEPRAHAARHVARSSRVFGIWGVALVVIATFGLLGRLFEPRPVACCDSRPAIAGAPEPEIASSGWPPNSHSAFRYPVDGKTRMTLQFERVPGLDGSVARLEVSGRIEGPVAKLAVQLVSGDRTFEEVTRHFSSLAGRPPSPFGAFDVPFRVPLDTPLSDLWVVARAYVDGRVVAVESFPVDPDWTADGPGRFVLDDVVAGTGPHPGHTYSLRTPLRY